RNLRRRGARAPAAPKPRGARRLHPAPPRHGRGREGPPEPRARRTGADPMTARSVLPPFPLKALQALLPSAFAEDEGPGDVTSEATLDPGHMSQGVLLCKEDGVLAGSAVMEAVFRHRGLAPRLEWLAA